MGLLSVLHWGTNGGTTGAASFLASFLASLVECVEALTVILAVGSVRGWSPALGGAGVALAVLAAIVAVLGRAMTRIPLHALQIGVGALLLLFGMRWLRKAILRSAGVIPLHDEAAAFAKNKAALVGKAAAARAFDRVAFGTAFNITMLEGAEVVFIVIAVGTAAPATMVQASLGAVAALVVVSLLGVALHRPLARVPENALKFAVGVLLTSFGSFWMGEGFGFAWADGDWSLFGLAGGFLLVALVLVVACRRSHAQARAAVVRA
jgi:uncharacterized membrane protein